MSAGKIDGLKACFYDTKLFGKGELKTADDALKALTKKLTIKTNKGVQVEIGGATIKRVIQTISGKMTGTRTKDAPYKTQEFKTLFLEVITSDKYKVVLFSDHQTLSSLPDQILSDLLNREVFKGLQETYFSTTLEVVISKMKSEDTEVSNNFTQVFNELLKKAEFKNALFGSSELLESLPDEILVGLSSQLPANQSHLLTLFTVLREKATKESDQKLNLDEDAIPVAFNNLKKECNRDQLVHLLSSLSDSDICFDKLSKGNLRSFLNDLPSNTKSAYNTIQPESSAPTRVILASGRFPQRPMFLAVENSVDTSTDDDTPVKKSPTEIVREGEGFSPGVNFSLSKDPLKQLTNNSYVIYPSAPGEFELAVSDNNNQMHKYPLSRENGRWTVVGCPLDFFVPLPTKGPLALSSVQKMDYDFNVGKGQGVFPFAFNIRNGRQTKCLQARSLAEALKLAHRLLLAKTSEMSFDVFVNFDSEFCTAQDRLTFVTGATHYDFLVYPSSNPLGKYEVSYKPSQYRVGMPETEIFDSLKDAATFAETLLMAKEIDPQGLLPSILLKFVGEKSRNFSILSSSLDPGELVVYRDSDQKHKIAVRELDGGTRHIYGLKGDSVQTAQKYTSRGLLPETQANQSLKDVLEYHALRDPLLEERNKNDNPTLHPHPMFNNLATKRGGAFDKTEENHSMTQIADIVVGNRTLPFIASSDPMLADGRNAASFYTGINLGGPVAVIKLNVGQSNNYFPDNVGETCNVGGVNVTTIQRRDYSFNNLDKIECDLSAYPSLDLSKLKIQVRELTFDGQIEGQTTLHISVAGWPDHEGLPPQILQAIRDQIKVILQEHGINFVFTHCRAGVGRTGTLAAALSLPDTYQSSELQKKINDMRENRSHMVQDLMQYVCLREMGELQGANPITFDRQDFAPPRPPKPKRLEEIGGFKVYDQDFTRTEAEVIIKASLKANKAQLFLIRYSAQAKGYVLSFCSSTQEPLKFSHLQLKEIDGDWVVPVSDGTNSLLNIFLKSQGLLPNTENISGGAVVKRPTGVTLVQTKGQGVMATGAYGAVKPGTVTVTEPDMIAFIKKSGIEYKKITYDGKEALEISDGLVVKKIELEQLHRDIQNGEYEIKDNKLILKFSLSEVKLKTKFAEFSRLPSEAAIKSSRERVQLEAKMGMRFDHPNIGRTVAVSDVYSGKLHHTTPDGTRYQVWAKAEDGTDVPVTTAKMFMLQQRITGKELFEVLTTSKPKDNEKMKWFFQILAGVQHIHEKRCVHRDLKLDNVMIDDAGNAVVMDFGFTRPSNHEDLQRRQGTPGYVAPEVFTALFNSIAPHDAHKVDSFALATLGEMLFFQSQRNSENIPIYFGDQTFNLSKFTEYVTILPEGPKKVIGKLLIRLGHPDPTQRLSVADCIAAIQADGTLCPLFNAALEASKSPPPLPPKA
jgi:serine/threonine protein kinase/protein-tyrosine phosphatase